MTGFLATLVIAAAGLALGLIIVRFSSMRHKPANTIQDVEEVRQQLLKQVEEMRAALSKKSTAPQEVARNV